jgi:hypothetical protein
MKERLRLRNPSNRLLVQTFAAALLVRLLFIAIIFLLAPGRIDQRLSDQGEMGKIAYNLAQGRGYSSPFDYGSQPTAWLCPAIPILWAAVIKSFGDSHATLLITLLQAIASSVSSVLYVAIFRRVSEHAASSSTLFAGIVALWPESIFRVSEYWYYAWQELGVAVLVWIGISWAKEQSLRNAVVLGLAGGLVALVNVNPVPLFLLALIVPLVSARVSAPTLHRAAVCLGVSILCVLPWLVRNAIVFNHFVPLRGNAGFQLYEGNNPEGCIRETITSIHPANIESELITYKRLGEYDSNHRAFRLAATWIVQHPAGFVTNAMKRAYVIWFTDISDKWSYHGTKWWYASRFDAVTTPIITLCAVGVLILTFCAVFRNGVRSIRYAHLIFGVPMLLPLPHYFTLADNSYYYSIRIWLLLIALLAYSTRNTGSAREGNTGLLAFAPLRG